MINGIGLSKLCLHKPMVNQLIVILLTITHSCDFITWDQETGEGSGARAGSKGSMQQMTKPPMPQMRARARGSQGLDILCLEKAVAASGSRCVPYQQARDPNENLRLEDLRD